MLDPAIAIALAGIVLAIALTLRFSRPLPASARMSKAGSPLSWPDGSAHDLGHRSRTGMAHLAASMPPGLVLYARVAGDADVAGRKQGPAGPGMPAADFLVCDGAHRPILALAPSDPARPVPDAGEIPVVTILAGADRATVAAMVAAAARQADADAPGAGEAGPD